MNLNLNLVRNPRIYGVTREHGEATQTLYPTLTLLDFDPSPFKPAQES